MGTNTAQGPYLGYNLQLLRLCLRLLESPPNSYGSFELLDDVAIHYEDGSLLLEQNKSSISNYNPLADSSRDLWKTFANWADTLRNKNLDASKTSYHLLVVSDHEAGEAVQSMHSLSNLADATAFLQNVRQRKLINKDTKAHQHYQNFLSHGPDITSTILCNFTVEQQQAPLELVRQKFKPLLADSVVDLVLQAALGNLCTTIEEKLRKKQEPLISRNSFATHIQNLVKRSNLTFSLAPTPEPDQGQIEQLIDSLPNFIKQLKLVDLSRSDIIRSASDLLRMKTDKTTWAEHGLISSEGTQQLDEHLAYKHSVYKDEIEDLNASDSAEMRGRLLYRRSTQYNTKLEERDVPHYFISGCYNDLADLLKIGWHPNFKSFFRGHHEE